MTNGPAPYDSRTYFASHDEPDFGKRLLAKLDEIDNHPRTKEIASRVAHAYKYYYGFDSFGSHGSSTITRSGEQGELATYRVNHARAVVNTLVNLVISQRVAWVPKATNIDYESLKQVEVAKAVLEYYWLERRTEGLVSKAVEEALALSEGFILPLWDENAGDEVEDQFDVSTFDGDVAPPMAAGPSMPAGPSMQPGGGAPMFAPPGGAAEQEPQPPPDQPMPDLAPKKKGDFTFENVSTWDVRRDPNKKSWEALDWVSVRVPRNKFDLAAQYPEYTEEILSCTADVIRRRADLRPVAKSDDTEDIEIEIFFHRKTAAVPGGRESWVLPNGEVIRDGRLSYEQIPLVRITPSDIIGAPFGYTQFFEILAIQELIDSLQSTAATNLTTFATQNIFLPSGSSINPEEISGGVRIIEGAPGGDKPQALQLCETPAELYSHLKELKQDLELVFGVNAVVRGQLQSDKLSGSALALLETQVKQQSSNLQGSYRTAIQSLGDFVVTEMRKRADAPRTINIVGKDNAFLIVKEQQYSGDDFSAIKRVLVDIGNPLSQSVFGRAEQAQKLVEMGLVNNLEQYFMMLDSGRTEPITQALTSELLLIKSENEDIADGVTPEVMLHDNHLLHGREHRSPVASPQARKDPKVLKADIEHMHKHYEAYFGVPAMQPQLDPMGAPAVDPETGEPVLAPEPMYRIRMLVLMGMQPPDPALGGIPGQAPGAPDGGQNLAAPGNAPGPAPQAPQQDAGQNTPAQPGNEPGGQAKPPKQPQMPKNPSTGVRAAPAPDAAPPTGA